MDHGSQLMILKYKNNILSVFLALSLIAGFNIYFYPNKVSAQTAMVPTTDLVQAPQTLMEWAKQMLGIVLKRAILDRIVDQTVAWIQNDFQGKPPFLQDPEAFKKQVIDNSVGAAIQSIVPGLCSPFSLQVQIGATGPARLSQPFDCTLKDVVSNINNFEEEFSKDGNKRWLRFATIWQPQNNIWGMTFMAESLKEKVTGQTAQAQNLSQTINMGFTAVETCSPPYIVKTVPCTMEQEGCSCMHTEARGNYDCFRSTNIKCTQGMAGCTCKIKTPGNFIASEVFGIASSGTEKNAILSASDVATYVGTLLDAIIGHYTQLGMRGLMGVLYPEAGDQKTEWDTAVRKAFSSLDAMTYNNIKTMYLDEINGVLSVKNSSLNKVQTLIDLIGQGSDIYNKLTVISSCPIPPASTNQPALAAVTLGGLENYLTFLNDQKDNIGGNVDDMNSVKSEMQNSKYPANPTDASGQAEQYASLSLLAGYQDLKDKKILDLDAANKELDSVDRYSEEIRLVVTKANSDYDDALATNCLATKAAAAAEAAAAANE